MLKPKDIAAFQRFVYSYHQTHGRQYLPWRHTTDPYHIAISEIMSQQTQIDRVIPKYVEFTQRFRSWAKLARATPAEVIMLWQGLGYNRRGLYLHRSAQHIVEKYGGILPSDTASLQMLPGWGPYTIAAVQAFAFNLPSIVIDTNVRTVFLYHFFPNQENVPEESLLQLAKVTLDEQNPRLWYSALLDYGAHLKQEFGNHTRRSSTYQKQSPLKGSLREIRGRVLKELSAGNNLAYQELLERTGSDEDRLKKAVAALLSEGFITKQGSNYSLKS
jgi:A/G-specific adenine glycosylase